MQGLGLRTDVPQPVKRGDRLRAGLWVEKQECTFPVEVAVVLTNRIGLRLCDLTIAEEKDYVRCTFASPDAWSDWDRGTEADRPLASFAEVFSFGATGYVRLLESIYNGITTWWRGALRQAPVR